MLAKVVSLDVPREVVTLRIEGEKPVRVPLADFDPPEEGLRPRAVGAEAWQRAQDEAAFGSIEHSTLFGSTVQLKGTDQLAQPGHISEQPAKRRKSESKKDRNQHQKRSEGAGSSSLPGRSKRRRQDEAAAGEAAHASRKLRRRRSTTLGQGEQPQSAQGVQVSPTQAGQSQPSLGSLRPGRRSSGLRNQKANRSEGAHAQKPQQRKKVDGNSKMRGQGGQNSPARKQGQPKPEASAKTQAKPNQQVHRRRRRSHKANGTQESQG